MEPNTLLDSSAIGVVVAVTAAIRKAISIPERYVPLIPVVVSMVTAFPVVYIHNGGDIKSIGVYVASSVLEGIKIAALSMAAYKVTKTTVLNKTSGEAKTDVQ
jgi:hypothetical protein